MMKTHTLYYIGGEYYYRSSTSIGVLYTSDYRRWDWGLVEAALHNGEAVTIFPASSAMLNHFTQMLNDILWDRLLNAKSGNRGA